MNKYSALFLSALLTVIQLSLSQAHALEHQKQFSRFECKSAHSFVQLSRTTKNEFYANYGIVLGSSTSMNDGAEVDIEQFYLSDRYAAIELAVDGQASFFELNVSRQNTKYVGTIHSKLSKDEAVECTVTK